MKPPRACRECRISKRRCTRRGPGEACAPCRQRNIACSTDIKHQQEVCKSFDPAPSARQEHQTQSSPEDLTCLSKETVMMLVEAYFDKAHDLTHSILHPATFRKQLLSDRVPKALLYAVCAIGSKFSSQLEQQNLREPLALEAKSLLQSDLENICLENIQTCMLVATLCGGNGQASSEGLYIRIAISMAEIMKLESIATSDPCVTTRETAKMVCWSLYLTNRRCFAGLGLPRGFEDFQPTCELPAHELLFRSLTPDQTRAPVPRASGLWAQLMTLTQIAGPVLEHNRRLVQCEIKPEDLASAVQHLESRFEKWLESLPVDARMTTQNLHHQQRNGLGGLFVAVHLAFYHYSTLLYFSFLERREAPSSICRRSIRRCKHYATEFSGLLHLSRQLDGCRVSCPAVGHMITVSSAVLVHTLLFGDTGEINAARQELNTNFEALIELQQPWPATAVVIGRLMKFQETCLLSNESHRLDGWMVRFLLDYSTGLEDREYQPNAANSNAETSRELTTTTELRELGFTIA